MDLELLVAGKHALPALLNFAAGSSVDRGFDAIESFRQTPPKVHVLVS
jgi:hypothetical protein